MKYLIFSLLVLPFFLNGIKAQIPSNVPLSGLNGYWPFNGNANDESGNGNNGTASSTVLSPDRFGNADKAYYFNGSNSYITVAHSNSTAITNGTINVWIKSSASQEMQILKKSNYSNASGEMFGLTLNHNDTNKVDWSVKYNSSCNTYVGWRSTFTPDSLNDDEWHMITATIGQNLISIYIDGQYVTTKAMPNTTSDFCNGTLEFGRNWLTNPRWYEGLIDDIGIWNRVLTNQEIATLYNPPTAVVMESDQHFSIYPNPAKTQISIESSSNAANIYSISICNTLGQQIYSGKLDSQLFTIDLSVLKLNGVNFLSIFDNKGKLIFTETIQVQP